jgi:hypothetical protein
MATEPRFEPIWREPVFHELIDEIKSAIAVEVESTRAPWREARKAGTP